jgi:hypothetical protein
MDSNMTKKLHKLQKLRIRSIEKQLLHDKKEYLESCEKVHKRESEINNINYEKNTLKNHIKVTEVSESPVKRERVNIRRYWLNYDLEMHEYYHEHEAEEREEKKEQYEKRKKNWFKEKLKAEKFKNLIFKNQIHETALTDNHIDELSQEENNSKR